MGWNSISSVAILPMARPQNMERCLSALVVSSNVWRACWVAWLGQRTAFVTHSHAIPQQSVEPTTLFPRSRRYTTLLPQARNESDSAKCDESDCFGSTHQLSMRPIDRATACI